MKTEKNFPYPLMAPWSKDVEPFSFDFKMEVLPKTDFFILNCKAKLANTTLIDLINNNQAKLLLHVICKSNFYRSTNEINLGSFSSKINSNLIEGKTEAELIICASENIRSYKIEGQHEDYQEKKFNILTGDILAISQTLQFSADKIIDPFKEISSILSIIKIEGEQNIPAKVTYDSDKIIVEMPEPEWKKYAIMNDNSKFGPTMSANILMPILVDIINQWKNGEENLQDLSEKNWFKAIKAKADSLGLEIYESNEEAFVLAQKLFELPFQRCIDELHSYL